MGEVRHKKPTREVCSSVPERTKYEGSRRDLIGQQECELEVFIGWKPHARANVLSCVRRRTCALFTMACACFLEGSSRHGRHKL